jgi:hypothetical protein
MVPSPQHAGVFVCRLCGVWLNNDACRRLIAGTLSEHGRVTVDRSGIDPSATRAASYRTAAPGAGAGCPECGAPLEPHRVFDIDVTLCAAHGTFFRLGTLHRVDDAYRARAASDKIDADAFVGELASERRSEAMKTLFKIAFDILFNT